jgi:hypothetical protein
MGHQFDAEPAASKALLQRPGSRLLPHCQSHSLAGGSAGDESVRELCLGELGSLVVVDVLELPIVTFVLAVGIAAAVGAFLGVVAGLHFGVKLLLPSLKEAFSGLIQADKDFESLTDLMRKVDLINKKAAQS